MKRSAGNRLRMKEEQSDAVLVAGCLEGDRESFARIVERYQRLLCSLALSATGNLALSEDIAQEAFVTAWQQMGMLREPDKLRPWLTGIVRNGIRRKWRSAGRDPVALADGEEGFPEMAAEDPCAAEQAMDKEEQLLLWGALRSIPRRYREPLVLFYREEHSVSAVACALELSETAVKQRLLRGRKLLKDRLLHLVEGALVRSAPGPAFTAGVVAAVATLSAPAKAAATVGLGAMAAEVTTTAKTASVAGLLAAFSGLISSLMAVRVGLDQARTVKERRATVWTALLAFGSFMVFVALVFGLRSAAAHWPQHAVAMAVGAQVCTVGFAVAWPLMFRALLARDRALRSSERQHHPDSFADARDAVNSRAGTYRSRVKLLGIPLVHIRFAKAEWGSMPVVGWIAGGDRAIGILFAWGGFAYGLVSVGAVSFGVFTLGGVGIGLLALGSVAFGYIGMGAVSIGQHAVGSLSAMGWKSAIGGGFVISHDYAVGPIALAPHANDATAQAFFAHPHADMVILVFYAAVVLFTLAPVFLYAKGVRTRLGTRK